MLFQKKRLLLTYALQKHKSSSWLTNGDTDSLEIVAEVLQGDSLASYRFIICHDFILWVSNVFKLR